MSDKIVSRDDFTSFFCAATGLERPYAWQVRVALEGLPDVLPIPTGLGKTEGAVLAWAWRKLVLRLNEPLHLIYCLPMRSLVRQTVERLNRYFDAISSALGLSRVSVHQLMGGAIDEEWARWPDRPWVLVGTQDQLLSRALNRGYAMNRFDWPVHFGLLNQDCHWIVDEVQLMGPGVWTTSQLDWMRRKRFAALRPCRTTWMSATIGTGFLATADRRKYGVHEVEVFEPRLDEDDNEELQRRHAARRSVEWILPSSDKRAPPVHEQIAACAVEHHCEGTLTLIICNTVKTAQQVFRSLPNEPCKILLTSRFRQPDRRTAELALLDFEARRNKAAQRNRAANGKIEGDPGLICVSTQVVEAGLDISAHRLWSELAPWPSVIQRLGRLNRDGRDAYATAHFWKTPKGDEQKRDLNVWVGPYPQLSLKDAEILLDAVMDQSRKVPFARALKTVLQSQGELLQRVLQPTPEPLPRAIDVHGLFSTERDVHGGFTDISAFVRGSDPDADLTVFWRDWSGATPPRDEALDGPPFDFHAEGCAVAYYRMSELLKASRAKAWIWNDEDEKWESCPSRELRPGMVVMLPREVGGYSARLGWTGNPSDVLQEVPRAGHGRGLRDDQRTETGYWSTLDGHLRDVRAEAQKICDAVDLREDDRLLKPVRTAVIEAATLHDIGKAHPTWQRALPANHAIGGGPWAKCPRVLGIDAPSADCTISAMVVRLRPEALTLPEIPRRQGGVRLRWAVEQKLARTELDQLLGIQSVCWAGHVPFRPGMRHEAASALAMWHRYRDGRASYPALAVYLVAAHHGKVRTVLRATSTDGGDVFGVTGEPRQLDIGGEGWPLDFSVAHDGAAGEWRSQEFVLTDYGWTGLVADLLGPWRDRQEDDSDIGVVPEDEPRCLGPFVLAWLEALVRVADWRASASPSKSIRPSEVRGGG